eukprot:14046836-Alexandrium_andersonii.AAC.1
MLAEHVVLPGAAPREGRRYLAADGGRAPKLGEVEPGFATKERHRCKIKFQVGAAKRPLLAVSALTKDGNE